MENMMENLEQGGKVSKASQGLSGAREMFATSTKIGRSIIMLFTKGMGAIIKGAVQVVQKKLVKLYQILD